MIECGQEQLINVVYTLFFWNNKQDIGYAMRDLSTVCPPNGVVVPFIRNSVQVLFQYIHKAEAKALSKQCIEGLLVIWLGKGAKE